MKVAVLGCGTMGMTHIENFNIMSSIELVAVFDTNESLANQVAEQFLTTAYTSFEDNQLLNSNKKRGAWSEKYNLHGTIQAKND